MMTCDQQNNQLARECDMLIDAVADYGGNNHERVN